MISTLLDIEK